MHAHQVLQHVSDPVRALREMRRVCRPGGVVAARDSDYAAFTWFPEVPELDRWLEVYRRVARSNDAEPDAGRRLLSWAQEAGFPDVTAGSSTWCYSTPIDRAWWGGLWADRIVESDVARQAVDRGFATVAELAVIAAGWRRWADRGRRLVQRAARRDPGPRLSLAPVGSQTWTRSSSPRRASSSSSSSSPDQKLPGS